MKGFKGTNNMKCRDFTYEVGKTYSINKLKICYHGFHFCEKMENVLFYYDPTEDFVLLEVEALGKIETDGDKSATDKLKVIRIVPESEYTFKIDSCEYDEKGNLISMTYPNGDVYKYEYDEKGNKISETSPLGNVSKYEYDEKGNKISMTFPSGDVYKYEYDENGNKIYETRPNGYVIKYEYDENGNMISQKLPSGYVFKYEYDEKKNKISMTYPSGDSWKITIE
jgi:YD repeat-containing protein